MSEDLHDIQEVINATFDEAAGIPAVRANLVKLNLALRGLRASILYSDLADEIPKDTLCEAEFIQALAYFELARLAINKAAMHLP